MKIDNEKLFKLTQVRNDIDCAAPVDSRRNNIVHKLIEISTELAFQLQEKKDGSGKLQIQFNVCLKIINALAKQPNYKAAIDQENAFYMTPTYLLHRYQNGAYIHAKYYGLLIEAFSGNLKRRLELPKGCTLTSAPIDLDFEVQYISKEVKVTPTEFLTGEQFQQLLEDKKIEVDCIADVDGCGNNVIHKIVQRYNQVVIEHDENKKSNKLNKQLYLQINTLLQIMLLLTKQSTYKQGIEEKNKSACTPQELLKNLDGRKNATQYVGYMLSIFKGQSTDPGLILIDQLYRGKLPDPPTVLDFKPLYKKITVLADHSTATDLGLTGIDQLSGDKLPGPPTALDLKPLYKEITAPAGQFLTTEEFRQLCKNHIIDCMAPVDTNGRTVIHKVVQLCAELIRQHSENKKNNKVDPTFRPQINTLLQIILLLVDQPGYQKALEQKDKSGCIPKNWLTTLEGLDDVLMYKNFLNFALAGKEDELVKLDSFCATISYCPIVLDFNPSYTKKEKDMRQDELLKLH